MRVTNKNQIPNNAHYQLIVFSSIQEDTGYKDYSSHRSITDIFLLSEEELKKEILTLDKNGTPYVVQHVDKRCNVKIQAVVGF